METNKTSSTKICILGLAAIPLAVMLYTAIDLIKTYQGAYVLLFTFFYILFPGFTFSFLINRNFAKDNGKWSFLISFFTGFFLITVQYFLLNYLHCLFLIRYTPLVLGIASSAIRFKDIRSSISKPTVEDIKKSTPFLFFMAFSTLGSFYALYKLIPNEQTNFWIDYAYHMGNVDILTKAGDFMDTRVYGMTFKYHYFSDLYYGILRNIFPFVTIWNCIFRFPIILVPILISTSLYNLFGKVTDNRLLRTFICCIVLFAPSLNAHYTTLTSHVLSNMNAVGFALPCAIGLFYLLSLTFSSKVSVGAFVQIFALSLVLTGLKGPFTMTVIGCYIVFIFAYLILERKLSVSQLIALGLLLVSFAIIWFTLLNVAVNEGYVNGDVSGLSKYIKLRIVYPDNFITHGYDFDSKHAILFSPINLLYTFGAASLPFVLNIFALIIKIFKKKKVDYFNLFVTFCGITSIGLNYLLAVDRNKIYFSMFGTAFIYVAAAYFIKDMFFSEKKKTRILALATMLFSSYILAGTLYYTTLSPTYVGQIGSLSQTEIDALTWIRENTDQNDMLAINNHYPNGKSYYYSGFSERQYYLESYNYAMNSGKSNDELSEQDSINASLFTGTPESMELAKSLGVDYLIMYDGSGLFEANLDSIYTCSYSNDNIRIYKVEG